MIIVIGESGEALFGNGDGRGGGFCFYVDCAMIVLESGGALCLR